MTAVRRVFAAMLCAVGTIGLPACVVTSTKRAVPAPVAPAPLPTPAASESKSQFAELIRGPGERVAVQSPEPKTEQRIAEPSMAPIPVAGTEVVVPPPNPVAQVPPLAPPPPPPDPPLIAAVRAYLDHRPEAAAEHLKDLDGPNRELLLQLIPPLVKASQVDLKKATPHEYGVLAGQLDAPAATLARKAPLFVEKVCFCRWVKNFGRYDPLPERHAIPAGSLAELYVEVRNVPSEPTESGDGYVTRLACSLQVRDGTGAVVPILDANRKPVPSMQESKQDFTRSPIRDYFLLFRFAVPVKPGTYAATIEVRDVATGRVVTRSLPLRVQ